MAAVIIQDNQVTNRELSRWLAEGNGEVRIDWPFGDKPDVVCTSHSYTRNEENDFVYHRYRIRKWCDVDWRHVSRSYMAL